MIQRYWETTPKDMTPGANGTWVRYEDHALEIAKLQKERDDLRQAVEIGKAALALVSKERDDWRKTFAKRNSTAARGKASDSV